MKFFSDFLVVNLEGMLIFKVKTGSPVLGQAVTLWDDIRVRMGVLGKIGKLGGRVQGVVQIVK
jgi:hypothetical protein